MDVCDRVRRYSQKISELQSNQIDEVRVLKWLSNLAKMPITLDILKSTGIGKSVNQLRKDTSSRPVAEEAKKLVGQWKKLVNTNGESSSTSSPCTSRNQTVGSRAKGLSADSRPALDRTVDSTRKHQVAPGPSLAGMMTRRRSSSHNEGNVDSQPSQNQWPSVSSGTPQRLKTQHPSASLSTSAMTSSAKKPALSPSIIASSLPPTSPVYRPSYSLPLVHNKGDTSPTKRKVARAQDAGYFSRAKDTHTIYSGRRRERTFQTVPTLFSMAMQVLMDHIDDIEETGLPYHVLAPLLQRATPSQLQRLEEFNPQLVPDTDCLWEGHCKKEFPGNRPHDDQTWGELYEHLVEAKSKRLQQITARINQQKQVQAKEDAKHTVKVLTSAKSQKRRRSGGSSGLSSAGSRSSVGGSARDRVHSPPKHVKPIMQKTLKMLSSKRSQFQVPLSQKRAKSQRS